MSEVSNKRFVHFSGTREEFEAGGYAEYYPESIVFINANGDEYSSIIYTHGEYYGNGGVISKGDVDNSGILIGEYDGYKNRALSKVSLAIGAASTAGLKGWYYTHVNISNKQIFLGSSRTKILNADSLTCTSTLYPDSKYTDSSFVSGYEVGDKISLVYNAKYEDYATITAISGNILTLDKIPFVSDDFVAGVCKAVFATDPDEFSVYCIKYSYNETTKQLTVSKYDAGGVDFGGGALAEGVNNYALNIGAHAEGIQTVAKGQYSHTEGFKTIAGYAAHAEGKGNIASGQGSHAEGQDNTSAGNVSHTEGRGNYVQSSRGHAEGENNYVGDTDRTTPDATNTSNKGFAAHAEGQSNTALGNSSHVEGIQNKTTGLASHAEGRNTTASGDYSHAEGSDNTTASGYASHAEGAKTLASGDYSHAEGYDTTAGASYSHAGGYHTSCNHSASFVHGLSLYSTRNYSAVFGAYNRKNESDIFSIGVGTSTTNTTTGFSVKTTGDASVYDTLYGKSLNISGGVNNRTRRGYYYKHVKTLSNKNRLMFYLSSTMVEPTMSSESVTKDETINPYLSVSKGDTVTVIYNDVEFKGTVYQGSAGQIQVDFQVVPFDKIILYYPLHRGQYMIYFDDYPDLGTVNVIKSSYMFGIENVTGAENSMCIGTRTQTSNKNELAVGTYNYSQDGTLFSVGNGSLNDRRNVLEVRDNEVWVWWDEKGGYIKISDLLKKNLISVYDKNGNTIIDVTDAMTFITLGEVVNKDGYALKVTLEVYHNDYGENRTVYYNYIDNSLRTLKTFSVNYYDIYTTVFYNDNNIITIKPFESPDDHIIIRNAEWVDFNSLFDDDIVVHDYTVNQIKYLISYKEDDPLTSFYYDGVPFEERVLNPISTSTPNIGYDIIETEDSYIFAFYNSPHDSYSEYMFTECTNMPQSGKTLQVKCIYSTMIKITYGNGYTKVLPYIRYYDFNLDDNFNDIELNMFFGIPFDCILKPNGLMTITDDSNMHCTYIEPYEYFQETPIYFGSGYSDSLSFFGYNSYSILVNVYATIWDSTYDEYMPHYCVVNSSEFEHGQNNRVYANCKLTDDCTIIINFYNSDDNLIFMSYFYDFEVNTIDELEISIKNVR